MNRPILIYLCFMLLFVMSSCINSETDKNKNSREKTHETHNSIQNDFTHKDIVILDTVYKVNDTISGKFREVLDLYLQIAKCLVDENTDSVDQFIAVMNEKIKIIPVNSFKGKERHVWEQHAMLYEEKFREMLHIAGIENKRSYFSHISEIMYCTVKSFVFYREPLYVDYCPMAFDGKGAYWLSESNAIQNPYFGKSMLNCGEIKEKI